jgi:A/G-specific adenine glycosylase
MARKSDKLRPVWTRGLARWYAAQGRHDLPWRLTRDPWLILVSEVMLQQTQVRRVVPKWEEFATRWPTPATFAAATPSDVLRAWQGLGYPRRALALHRAAAIVSRGWPHDEIGLRALPGVGEYTARALLTLAFGRPGALPCDVNVGRVTARAALGVDPAHAGRRAVAAAVRAGQPRGMSGRSYTYALFDAGALHCRATPRCDGCPLARGCAFRRARAQPAPPRRGRSPRYAGSTRELRGRLLRAILAGTPADDLDALHAGVEGCEAATSDGAIAGALEGLARDGLVAAATS